MQKVRTVLMVGLALVIAAPMLAAVKKAHKAPPCPAAQRVEKMTEGLTLTDEQKSKLDAVCKELGPKMMDAMKKGDVLTPEQKKAQAEARNAAKAAGKTGKEAHDDVAAAVKVTDEQKAKQGEARKEMGGLEKCLREKVMAVLKKKFEAGKKKPAK